MCQGWRGKEVKNISICGKKVYRCQVKSRIFCSPFQNSLKHRKLNILNQIIHFNWAKLYTMRSHFFAYNQYIYRIWCCLENHFKNVTSNTMRGEMHGIYCSHGKDDGIFDQHFPSLLHNFDNLLITHHMQSWVLRFMFPSLFTSGGQCHNTGAEGVRLQRTSFYTILGSFGNINWQEHTNYS